MCCLWQPIDRWIIRAEKFKIISYPYIFEKANENFKKYYADIEFENVDEILLAFRG